MKRLKWIEIKRVINDRIEGYNFVIDNHGRYMKEGAPLSKFSIKERIRELENVKEVFDIITNRRDK